MTLFLALALVAALVTLVGSYVVWKLSLKYRLYPKIRERDVHTRPTPRLGGIAMFVGILVAFGAAWFVSSLGPTRFANVAIIFQDPTQVLAILGAALLIVLVMNAVNFIDGLDGLVAGVSLISNGVFFVYTYLLVQQTSPTNYFNLASMIAIILVGACAGFLPLNWRPAKLFMGDAGALLIGLLMATSAISVTGQINPAAVGIQDLFAAVSYTHLTLPTN